MIKRISFFLLYFLYWLGFFLVARLIFMSYSYTWSLSLNFGEWGAALLYGAWMDASMSGYISAVAALLLTLTCFSDGKTTARILSVYTGIMLAVAGLLVVTDMELYRHWGFRLDATPLAFLKTPKEAFASVDFWRLLIQLSILAGLLWGSWKIYTKLSTVMLKMTERIGVSGLPVFLFACALMILPIRGGLGVAPMNVGFVYHSDHIFANHAAINVMWNIGKSLTLVGTASEYHFMEKQQAESLFEDCYPTDGRTQRLLRVEQPNVVLIILESFSNRMIAALGGRAEVTPNLNRLCEESIVFTNIYSASDRTDKGFLGVFSGYPAHPVARVINFAEKTRQLPFLNKDLQRAGYHTEHISGFDNKFANILSYLGNAGYDRIIDRDDFPEETYRGTKWGVPDHWVFEKLLERCNQAEPPFFKSFMSLSSHEPFDVPMETVIAGNDDERRFLNAAYYTDRSLGAFIAAARQTEWWDSTLIVITADHGSRLPGNTTSYEPEKFHIPMIWTGGAIAQTDTLITTLAAQTDIAYTILCQLGLANSAYKFSKDILGTTVRQFAFYDFNNGFGWLTDSAAMVLDNVSNTLIFQEGKVSEHTIETGKAYLQVFSNDFKAL
jgi:phosphoglycerol transferase MdoB-like AlkP superfamily enzyme